MLTFLTFFLVLSILVLVHELGHFWAAKKSGILVEEFGFGLPPRLFGIHWGETIYSVNALPFGGFVRLYGEEGEEKDKGPMFEKKISKKRAFYAKSLKIKALVVGAGVIMNLLLAVVVFSVSYSVTGIPEVTENVRIVEISEGSPAQEAGLMVGDRITAVGATVIPVTSLDDFSTFVSQHGGEEVQIQVERDNQLLSLTITPRTEFPENEGPTGVAISSVEEIFYPWWQMPFRGAWIGVQEAFSWTILIVSTLGAMLWQLITSGRAPEGVAGPVGIYQITGQVVQFGPVAVMRFMGILSINLAVLNILPLPAIDGGRLLFIVWEGITGRKVKARVEHWIHSIGMAVLIFLLIVITINDLLRLFGQSWWVSRVRELLGS